MLTWPALNSNRTKTPPGSQNHISLASSFFTNIGFQDPSFSLQTPKNVTLASEGSKSRILALHILLGKHSCLKGNSCVLRQCWACRVSRGTISALSPKFSGCQRSCDRRRRLQIYPACLLNPYRPHGSDTAPQPRTRGLYTFIFPLPLPEVAMKQDCCWAVMGAQGICKISLNLSSKRSSPGFPSQSRQGLYTRGFRGCSLCFPSIHFPVPGLLKGRRLVDTEIDSVALESWVQTMGGFWGKCAFCKDSCCPGSEGPGLLIWRSV